MSIFDLIALFASFQFYDSPIKSRFNAIDSTMVNGFNSMIVRLKDPHPYLRACRFCQFQFYDSPIKRKTRLVVQD